MSGINEYLEVALEETTDYTISGNSIVINPSVSLDNNSDLIISYDIKIDKNMVLEWTFSSAEGFEHSTTIFNPITLDPAIYLGTYYSRFNETYTLSGTNIIDLNKGFSGIGVEDFIIHNITKTNGDEITSYSIGINGNQVRITLGSSYSEDLIVEYGIATYELDRGYQRIEYNMSDSVRKLSQRHSTHKIHDYDTSTDVELIIVPDDPEDPMEAGDSKILISILEENKTTIAFNQLALLYDTVLNGSFYLDDCVLASGTNNLKPILATFTFITEDGESYFDFVNIDQIGRASCRERV